MFDRILRVYREMLKQNEMINAKNDCQLRANREGLLLLHDNISSVNHENIIGLSMEVFLYPPYSPDLAPSDYHLFWSLQRGFSVIISNENDNDQQNYFFQYSPFADTLTSMGELCIDFAL